MTDTDRKLLELAAKAAGIKIDKNGPWVEGRDAWAHATREEWNPIEDDGDAMRLAVKTGVDVSKAQLEYWKNYFRDSKDPYAATRRAITRAAAEIGRSMK